MFSLILHGRNNYKNEVKCQLLYNGLFLCDVIKERPQTYLNIPAINNVKGHRVEDKSIEDFAQDFSISDPLIKIFLGNFLQQVGDPLQGLVLQLHIALRLGRFRDVYFIVITTL